MYKLLFLFLYIFTSLLNAQDLDNLLRLYQTESELSNKTKDENAGSLVVYTRDDLERMQVETLKDILKSTRYFRYFENRLAEPDVLNADPVAYNSKYIKIYLNDTELFLPIFGTGLPLFGDIEMDFIDHVEIYQGFPSFEYAIDPALIIIKLYTKDPKKDAGSRVKLLVASHNSHKENVYTSDITENDLAYFLYANHTSKIQDKYYLEGKTPKRDSQTNHFFASLKKNDYKLDFNVLQKKQDTFLGELPLALPKKATKDASYISASLSHAFLEDKSISFQLSYINTSGDYNTQYAAPIPIGNYSIKEQNTNSNALTLITKKRFSFKTNSLTVGAQYRHKSFNLDDITIDGIANTTNQSYNREDIYSLFLEESLYLSENDLLGLSVMGQYYDRNRDMKNLTPLQLRLSYIKSLGAFTSKTFLSKKNIVPEPYMTATAYTGNPNLDIEVYSAATEEFQYETQNIVSKAIMSYVHIDNFLLPSITGVIQNSKKETNTYAASLELKYKFREKDQIELRAETLKIVGTDEELDETYVNYLFRMLNSVSKFDIFNEVVVNSGYQDIPTAYDYSAGVKYAYCPDIHIAFKGENIFNKGLKRKYLYSYIPTRKDVAVPVIEQKFMFTLEYLF